MQQCQKTRQSASHTGENVLSQHYRWDYKGMSPKVHKTMTCTKGGTGRLTRAPQLATCQHNPYDTHVYKEDFLWGPLPHTPPGKYST
jgi:hypothetical protein